SRYLRKPLFHRSYNKLKLLFLNPFLLFANEYTEPPRVFRSLFQSLLQCGWALNKANVRYKVLEDRWAVNILRCFPLPVQFSATALRQNASAIPNEECQ